jgi:cytoskeleton protein RodZ
VRLERGQELEEVAKQLRIKPAYLFAIEQGDLSALPGRTYALGFLRTYADHLGFDGAELIARIKSSVGELPGRPRLRVRAPMPENRLPRTPMVVISLAVIFGAYVGWSYVNRSSRMVVDTVAELPQDLRASTAVAEPDDGPALAGSTAETRGPDERPGGAGGEGTADAPASATQAARTAAPAPAAAPDVTAVAAGTSEPATARPPEPPGSPRDTPLNQPAEPQGDSAAADGLAPAERAALALQPAAGGESSGSTATTSAGRSLAAAEEAPAIAERDMPAAAAAPSRAAEAAGETADADAARRAVALLLDPAARRGDGAPRVYERTNADARVILRAREPTWVQLSSRAGDYSFSRTLEPGEAVLVPNRADLELWTGNANGLDIIVDGTPVPALAGGGAVRRNVSLDPDRLLQAMAPAR